MAKKDEVVVDKKAEALREFERVHSDLKKLYPNEYEALLAEFLRTQK